MEKQYQRRPFEQAAPVMRGRDTRRSFRVVAAVVTGLLIYYAFTIQGSWFPFDNNDAPTQSSDPFDFAWDDLPASPKLEYQPCYEGFGPFQCARLEVPMDYFNGTTDAKVGIAIIKLPAKVEVTDPRYGGAVLHNPGGPGGSGVGFLVGAGKKLQEIVGDPDGLQFDHISFDPRGVAFTQPAIDCFNDATSELLWAVRVQEEGVYSSSDAAFGRLWSMAVAQSESCSFPLTEGDADIKQYANTAFVARDMLEIVERHGEWREAEAKRILAPEYRAAAREDLNVQTRLPSLMYKPGKEKINYWGFSYGTYLGNTFAAMYPDRVNRLIADGVVDAYDYRKTYWLDNLHDTERAFRQISHHCARVGYPTCKLANETGETTAEGVAARIDNILTSLYHNPLPLVQAGNPGVWTYSDMKYLLFASLYTPLQLFPLVTEVMKGVEEQNLLEVLGRLHVAHPNLLALAGGSTMAIACSDGESQNGVSKDEFREYLEALVKVSPHLGDLWASILRLSCIHYKVRAHYRFTADWVANTSHPVLEIGNTADPVTPGRFAAKMAKGFTGAVALIQDSAGHCSISAPSNCTQSYVRQYFQTGALPEEGTVCPVDELPFGDAESEERVLDAASLKLQEQLATISKALYASRGGVNGFAL